MRYFLDRSLPILKEEGINILSNSAVAISGLGGVGGGAFLNLVRCGVKKFKLAENGIFDPPDMNRQIAAFSSTMGKPKLDVYVSVAKEINPEIELELFPEGINVENLENFLKDTDVYIGVIDAEKGEDVKAITSTYLKKYNIPLFSALAVGFGAILVAHHHNGMMPEEFWSLINKKSDNNVLFPSMIADNFHPEIMRRIIEAVKNKKQPTLSIGGSLSGTLLASEVITYILRDTELVNREIIFAPKFIIIDLALLSLKVLDVTEEGI